MSATTETTEAPKEPGNFISNLWDQAIKAAEDARKAALEVSVPCHGLSSSLFLASAAELNPSTSPLCISEEGGPHR